ncbi:MAG: ABC transporter substrate-binding protein, partial [Proteobacteria bacterium]|nr:ABC transporter substrate-binding protein [Pseudomonadota bacterium]
SWAVAGDVLKRAAAYDIPAERVDGTDFFAVHAAAATAVERARAGHGPSLLHIMVPRFFGHFSGDSDTYRRREEKEAMRRERDCLKIFRAKVAESGRVPAAEFASIDAEVNTAVDQAVKAARAAPRPDPKDVATDVYVSYA